MPVSSFTYPTTTQCREMYDAFLLLSATHFLLFFIRSKWYNHVKWESGKFKAHFKLTDKDVLFCVYTRHVLKISISIQTTSRANLQNYYFVKSIEFLKPKYNLNGSISVKTLLLQIFSNKWKENQKKRRFSEMVNYISSKFKEI